MVPSGPGTLSSPAGDWSALSSWWLDELAGDPAYVEEVLPLAIDLIDPQPERRYLDLGCGEGRVMAAINAAGGVAVGVDVSPELLERAARHGPVVRAAIPPLPFLVDQTFDGVVIVLVLEHLADERAIFDEAARVTRPGGTLALVVNHPAWTAPGSTPVTDEEEVLWRPGEYFSTGWSADTAGDGSVRFHHRTMARLLSSAAVSGWSLDHLVELGVSQIQVERTPGLGGQEHIPRLLGCRWRLQG